MTFVILWLISPSMIITRPIYVAANAIISFFFFFSHIFCQTSTGVNHRYMYIQSLLNLPPVSLPITLLQVDTETLFEIPDTYS